MFQKVLDIKRPHGEEGGCSIKFLHRKILVSWGQNVRKGTLYCFTKFEYRKTFCVSGEAGREGVARYSAKNFLSHPAQKFCGGTF